MPTRRILEVTVVTIILTKPVFGMVRLWAHRTLGMPNPNPAARGAAEIVSVVL